MAIKKRNKLKNLKWWVVGIISAPPFMALAWLLLMCIERALSADGLYWDTPFEWSSFFKTFVNMTGVLYLPTFLIALPSLIVIHFCHFRKTCAYITMGSMDGLLALIIFLSLFDTFDEANNWIGLRAVIPYVAKSLFKQPDWIANALLMGGLGGFIFWKIGYSRTFVPVIKPV